MDLLEIIFGLLNVISDLISFYYLYDLYISFKKDPIGTLQFTGAIALPFIILGIVLYIFSSLKPGHNYNVAFIVLLLIPPVIFIIGFTYFVKKK
jgi:hypothetical protein